MGQANDLARRLFADFLAARLDARRTAEDEGRIGSRRAREGRSRPSIRDDRSPTEAPAPGRAASFEGIRA